MEYTYDELQNYGAQNDYYLDELDDWFLVSGDMDDFIFFGEDDRPHSEK